MTVINSVAPSSTVLARLGPGMVSGRRLDAGVPWVTIALVVSALFVALLGLGDVLEFDRQAIVDGQWWRLATGHLAHFGLSHLAWDAAMLLVVGAAAERIDRRALVVTLLLSIGPLAAAIWCVAPEIARYRGLSGIDSALFTLLAVQLLRSSRSPFALIAAAALIAFVARSAIEFASGSTIFVDHRSSGFEPVPLVHIVGAVVGVVVGAAKGRRRPAVFNQHRNRNPDPCGAAAP